MSSGAGPSSTAPASSSAAAGTSSASAGSVFVKRAGDLEAVFAPVAIFSGDAVGHLAERASDKFRWLVGADKVKLFLVQPDGDDEPTAAEEEAALTQPRLQVGWPLSRARISSGAWVVARLSSPPAAAPGECARAVRIHLSCSLSREIRWGLRGALTLSSFPTSHPLPSILRQVAMAAAAQRRQHPAVALRARLTETSWRG